jgi:hypothetical protein
MESPPVMAAASVPIPARAQLHPRVARPKRPAVSDRRGARAQKVHCHGIVLLLPRSTSCGALVRCLCGAVGRPRRYRLRSSVSWRSGDLQRPVQKDVVLAVEVVGDDVSGL